MRVLFIGDVFGSTGRRVLAETLQNTLQEYSIDVCIANGENAAGGRGITENILSKFYKYGVNIVTGGNHSLAHGHSKLFDQYPIAENLLRPVNLKNTMFGKGKIVYTLPDGRRLGVINVLGQTFMNDPVECPFKTTAAIVEEMREDTNAIVVDFHAEATSEKACIANYLDGSVSAVLGTHTHIQTADERILRNGTAFITDAGMTGSEDSAIGMKLNLVIKKYTTDSHVRFEPATRGPMLNGVVVTIDDTSGKAVAIERVYKRLDFS